MDAIPEIFDAHGEAGRAGDAVVADGRDHQADAAGEKAAQQLAGEACGDSDEGEDREQEELRRPEQQHELLSDRQHREHGHGADEAAERVRGRGGADGVAGFALLREGIAVEAGCGVGRGAGCVEEDRGEGAAHGHGAHDAAGKRHRRERLKAVGERHQQRERRCAAKPRQCAEHETDRHAEAQEHQLPRLQQPLDPRDPCIQHRRTFPLNFGMSF